MFLEAVSQGEGPAIVLVHGALSDARSWAPQLEAFSAAGFQALALRLEGFWPDPFEPARFSALRHAEAIAAFVEQQSRPVHLLGHSRGGRLALAVAARRSQAIASLVLVEAGGPRAPAFFGSAEEAPHAGPKDDALALLAAGEVDRALQAYLDAGQGEGAWERSPAGFKALARANVATLYGMAMDVSEPLSRDVAAQVKCPALLVEGTSSPPVFRKINDVLEATLPDTRRIRLPGADHFLALTHAERFNVAVLDFVIGVPVSPINISLSS